jgi:hypothetical protein
MLHELLLGLLAGDLYRVSDIVLSKRRKCSAGGLAYIPEILNMERRRRDSLLKGLDCCRYAGPMLSDPTNEVVLALTPVSVDKNPSRVLAILIEVPNETARRIDPGIN